jgi:hypothetical protein
MPDHPGSSSGRHRGEGYGEPTEQSLEVIDAFLVGLCDDGLVKLMLIDRRATRELPVMLVGEAAAPTIK